MDNELIMLWKYQRADMEADLFEREMRGNPSRLKLLKDRDFLLEQQNAMRKIESDLAAMAERITALTADTVKAEESLRDLQETLEETEPESLDIARKSLDYCQKLMHAIGRMEQELQKIRKDSDVRAKQQHEVRVRAARVKAEFDKLKVVYDGEYKEQSSYLDSLRKRVVQAASAVPQELIAKYKLIKMHKTPPVSILTDDRCGGCNMNLPTVVMRSIRMGAESVDCENCGRIVLVRNPDEV
ncbi:MAG: C4-type zinc ribbon domain-containing protein [Oscillospiraceae bacterium]|jgi:predicted  nucleic acid-binding Zn-ribbon protein|nr:C4-type zinc ribbon domain-containing protein [Oscillospiraceae bacterium]